MLTPCPYRCAVRRYCRDQCQPLDSNQELPAYETGAHPTGLDWHCACGAVNPAYSNRLPHLHRPFGYAAPRTGFEPVISALTRRRLRPLDERGRRFAHSGTRRKWLVLARSAPCTTTLGERQGSNRELSKANGPPDIVSVIGARDHLASPLI